MKEINVSIIINSDDLQEVARAVTALTEAAGKLNATLLINRVNTTEVKWTGVIPTDTYDPNTSPSVTKDNDDTD